jgi:hypothetical protein
MVAEQSGFGTLDACQSEQAKRQKCRKKSLESHGRTPLDSRKHRYEVAHDRQAAGPAQFSRRRLMMLKLGERAVQTRYMLSYRFTFLLFLAR